MKKDKTFQEIFVRLKFSPETKIDKRTFAWRLINFNSLLVKNVSIDQEKNELSFTSEFNAEFSKEQIAEVMKNKTNFTTGGGLSLKFIEMELIEIKEEKEIYELD